MKLFLDSGPLIAKFNQKDPYYTATKHIFDQIQTQEIDVSGFFTSNLVIAETLTHVIYSTQNLDYCRKILNLVENSKYIEVIYINKTLDAASRAVFLKYFDHELSFVDCANIVIMNELRIELIFTFDEHFQKLGFTWLH